MCDKCVERIEELDPKILMAIHNNREAFISLMNKINDESGKILVQATVATQDPETNEVTEEEADEENTDTILTPEMITNTTALLVGIYLTGFLTTQIMGPNAGQIENMMTEMQVQGENDGHAYGHYQTITRH